MSHKRNIRSFLWFTALLSVVVSVSLAWLARVEFNRLSEQPVKPILSKPLHHAVWRAHQSQDSQAAEYVDVERVFPRLRFDRPVFLTGAGDGSGRLFVVEQAGVVHVFSMADHMQSTDLDSAAASAIPHSKVFLDIRDRISRAGNEEGLIGLAFHPDYKRNGIFYVHYSSSVKDMHGIVSRFRVSIDDPDRADVDSEQIILEQPQPYRNHNGGSIEFGPDGYLYITLGDGGDANDPHGHAQNMGNWLGAILRIDVDRHDPGFAYAVPPDNPFVDMPDAKPELWAIGLRNVWRMSFDRQTGQLWAADVGQNKWEEVSIIERGKNYGWKRYEALADFDLETELAVGEHAQPVAVYGRQWGISITGGYVYRGKAFPQLHGSYFYGDYFSGNLWRLRQDGEGKYQSQLVRRTGRSIASFGEDDDGELYLLSFDGGVYRIVPSDEPENTFEDWPVKLSQTGLYESTAERQPSAELVPYEINAPFWSDGATKQRFFRLPEGAKLGYRQDGNWEVPAGTILVKNFEGQHFRGRRMLETRLIKRTPAGWEAATYVWDLDGKDATLQPGGQQFELYQRPPDAKFWQVNSWHAPSSSECASCHTDAAGFVLGLRTAQLNRNAADGAVNQILKWSRHGLVKIPPDFDPSAMPRFADPYTAETGDVESRSRAWLDVNCAMCHRPDGPGNAKIDLRYETPLDAAHLLNVQPAQGMLGISQGLLIAPGDAERSLLLQRVKTLGQGRMPNLATNQIDNAAVQLLKQWITEME